MEKGLLVTIQLKSERDKWELEDVAYELEELVRTSGVEIIDNVSCICNRPTPNLFIGRGKADELALLAQEFKAGCIIFSQDLSGTQQRNLEDIVGIKTIDRTQLILHIFAKHARSLEGKMQVELAQLQYLLPRLVGKGLVLSRQGGGIGTSGPGETRLEVDKRRIRKRIDKLKMDLGHLTRHRATMRKRRKEKALPTAVLVGYTNAGKSTLLNALTDSSQAVSDGLFTTLDPLYKSLQLANGENIVISDTVGFLHNLPHHLIEAFKATLEEVVEADLLIHVLDVSHPRLYEHYNAVLEVLKELNADKKPIITALNKIDLLDDKAQIENIKNDFLRPVAISAKLRKNFKGLFDEAQKEFVSRMQELVVMVPHSRMDLMNLFYREGKVKKTEYLQEGIKVHLSLPKVLSHKLLHNKEIELLNSNPLKGL